MLDLLEAPAEAREALREVTETGQPRSLRVETTSFGGGDRRWYLIHAGAVREGGTTLGLTLVGIDVTEAQRVQAERERLLVEMERRNAELERFTYTVSHDLRSPLVTVRGLPGLPGERHRGGRTDRAAADVARIRAATEPWSACCASSSSSRAWAGWPTPRRTFRSQDLAEEARAALAGRLAAAGATVEVAADLPPVLFGDRARLREVRAEPRGQRGEVREPRRPPTSGGRAARRRRPGLLRAGRRHRDRSPASTSGCSACSSGWTPRSRAPASASPW